MAAKRRPPHKRAVQWIGGDGRRCSTSLFELSMVTFDSEFKY
jgi:hypothetical protein